MWLKESGTFDEAKKVAILRDSRSSVKHNSAKPCKFFLDMKKALKKLDFI